MFSTKKDNRFNVLTKKIAMNTTLLPSRGTNNQ